MYTGSTAFSAFSLSISVFTVSSTVLVDRMVSGDNSVSWISYVTPRTLSIIRKNCRSAAAASTMINSARKLISWMSLFNLSMIMHLPLFLCTFYQIYMFGVTKSTYVFEINVFLAVNDDINPFS